MVQASPFLKNFPEWRHFAPKTCESASKVQPVNLLFFNARNLISVVAGVRPVKEKEM